MAAFITSVYLSDKRDKDLLSLCVAMGTRNFRMLMKDAIRCTVRPYSAPKVPIPRLAVTNEVDEESLKSITVSISFGEENDGDIMDILKNRCKGSQRSFFCKEALRFHLGPAFVISSAIDVKTLERIKAAHPELVIPAIYGRTTRAPREGSEKTPVIQKNSFAQMRAEFKEELPTVPDDIQVLEEGVTGDKIQPLRFSGTYTDEKQIEETSEQKETPVIDETPIDTTEYNAQTQTTDDTSDEDTSDAAFDMLSAILGN